MVESYTAVTESTQTLSYPQAMEPGQLRGAWTLTSQDLEDLTNIARLKNFYIENFREFSDDEVINKLESIDSQIFISLRKYWSMEELDKDVLCRDEDKAKTPYHFSEVKNIPELFRGIELSDGHKLILLKVCETITAYWEDRIRRLGVELPTTRDNPRKK